MKPSLLAWIVFALLACLSPLPAQIYYSTDTSVMFANYTTGATSVVLDIPTATSLSGIVQAPNGEIFVGDAGTGIIYRFMPGSSTPTVFATLAQGVEGLALSASGTLFAGGASGGVFMISPSGTTITQLSSSGHAVFGITIDPEDNIYVANFANGGMTSYISKVTTAGTTTTLANINGANGVAYYGGFLYVAATGDSAIVKLDLSDNNVTTLSLADTETPFSLTVDSTGTVFALDNVFPNAGTDLVSFNSSGTTITTRTATPEGFYATAAVPEPTTLTLLVLGTLALLTTLLKRGTRSTPAQN